MILADYHTHTTFSDGDNTPEEMVEAAIAKGMRAIGFSDHSYTWFDESYCIPKARIPEYIAEIRRLRKKYQDNILILSGIEQDFYSDEPTDCFDYAISSVHYIHCGDEFIPVDETKDILVAAAEKYFNGDLVRLAVCYFSTVARQAEKQNCDIIGHIDLIRKFNRGGCLFDERDPRYIEASHAAVDALIKAGKIFEINTGAVYKGYQDTPYPSLSLLQYICSQGGKTIFSSDSHTIKSLCFGFQE